MNPEIKLIVEDMKKQCKEQRIADPDKQMYQMYQMAHLLSLLAQESEKFVTKTEKGVRLILRLKFGKMMA
jgi:hypothetical protein